MESRMNGNVTYRMLQHLAERAWDEGDEKQLYLVSAAVDGETIRLMAQEVDNQQAI